MIIKLISRFFAKLSKLIGKGGTTIGGIIAYKLDKNILRKLGSKMDTIIVVTGTNGKTTTSNLIASCFEESIIHNNKGANMYYGIISAFINGKGKTAVLEIDEGSINKIFSELKVDYFIVTNFFRDQLDRYGEIDMLVDKIGSCISKDTHLILNADDPFTMRLDHGNSSYYGLNKNINNFEDFEIAESRYCPNCYKLLTYEKIFYLQLGYYNCTCGFNHPKLDSSVDKIEDYLITINNKEFKHNLKGKYNAYNLAATHLLATKMNLNIEKGFNSYFSLDGRMQVIKVNDINHIVTLVKNPSGMNMSFTEINDNIKNVVFILNDGILDGIDVSWIWDADFEVLDNNCRYYVCGTRKEDMAIRLKYAGINTDKIIYIDDLNAKLDKLLTEPTFAISSYTSIQDTRKIFERRSK